MELRAAIARALRWAERTAALAAEAPPQAPARAAVGSALAATEALVRRVEADRGRLLRALERAPARGE
jgi:hypothetical protein